MKDKLEPVWWVLGALVAGVAAFFVLRKANEVVGLLPVEPRSQPLTLPNTKQAFVATMRSAISAALPGVSPYTVTLAVAQAAHESSFGKTVGWKQLNNPWNVTVGKGINYGGYNPADGGVLSADKGAPGDHNVFRRYRSYAAAAADWFGLLKANYPQSYAKLMAGDQTYITTLGDGSEGRRYYGVDPLTHSAAEVAAQPAKYQTSVDALVAEIQAL